MNENKCNVCEKVLWGGIPVSVVLLVLGLAIIIRPNAAGTETIVVSAVAMLIESVDLMRRGIFMFRSGSEYALMQFAIAVLTALAATLLLVNPFTSLIVRARYCGGTILALGLMTLAGSLLCNGMNRECEN